MGPAPSRLPKTSNGRALTQNKNMFMQHLLQTAPYDYFCPGTANHVIMDLWFSSSDRNSNMPKIKGLRAWAQRSTRKAKGLGLKASGVLRL